MTDAARATNLTSAAGLIVRQPRARAGGRLMPFDRWLGRQVQQRIADAPVRLELWDGRFADGAPQRAAGDLIVHDRRVLIGLAMNPELYFGEAYAAGRLEVRGFLPDVLAALSRRMAPRAAWRERLAAVLSPANSLTAARRNVHHHYDLGNDFYARWLDREMVYTCAYYADAEMSLEAAQRAKLDLVCRKLQLRAGETVVEAGCGWGALARYMGRQYGVRVKAFNLSREQLDWARTRARTEGLDGQVEFIEDDYRNVTGEYDAFVSVGMLEHVGRASFHDLAHVVRRTVRRSGGRGLLHFIGRDAPRRLNPWIRRRIFPGAYTPTLAEVTADVLAPAGMSVVDVENLRLHYARTLAHWSSRFAVAREPVREAYGEEFRRTWELYLAGSEAAFALGWLQLFQVVFSPRASRPPFLTRAILYGRDERPV
ncbi:MAG: cyclopropane-fatty-acyl-phospholipid synthase family protein [Vicinamibacterales bacterium]